MLLSEGQIATIENTLGYVFNDKNLLVTAFTHSSYINEHPGVNDGQVLEFYGDTILKLILIETILEKFPQREYDEGVLTNLRTSLENNEYLTKRMQSADLERYVIKGNGASISQSKGLADLFESLIAAVYIDSGKNISVTSGVAGRILKPEEVLTAVNSASDAEQMKHPKNKLQEWCQNCGYSIPDYKRISLGRVTLFAAGHTVEAYGVNYEDAEKKAAEQLLAILENGTSTVAPVQEAIWENVDLSDETLELDEYLRTEYRHMVFYLDWISESHPISKLNLLMQKIDPYKKLGIYINYAEKANFLERRKNINHMIYSCTVGIASKPNIPPIITYGKGINSSDARVMAAKKLIAILEKASQVDDD